MSPFHGSMRRVSVDWNEADAETGQVWTSLRGQRFIPALAPNEAVVLYDGEGEECAGTVERLDGLIAYFDIDYSTWESIARFTWRGEV